MSEYISHSEHDTEDIGASFARTLKGGTVVAMYGDLGAGKTAFVRGMARGMGLDCRVSSPTFTIVNEYLGERELIHFDMYRLSSADELFDIGWGGYLHRGAGCARAAGGSRRRRRLYRNSIRRTLSVFGGAGLCPRPNDAPLVNSLSKTDHNILPPAEEINTKLKLKANISAQ